MDIVAFARNHNQLEILSSHQLGGPLFEEATKLVKALSGTHHCRVYKPTDNGLILAYSRLVNTPLDARTVPLSVSLCIEKEEAASLTLTQIKALHDAMAATPYNKVLEIPNRPAAELLPPLPKEAPLAAIYKLPLIKGLCERHFGGGHVYDQARPGDAYRILLGLPQALAANLSWSIGLPLGTDGCIHLNTDLTFVEDGDMAFLSSRSGLPAGRLIKTNSLRDQDLDLRTIDLVRLLEQYPKERCKAHTPTELLDALRQHDHALHPPKTEAAKEPEGGKRAAKPSRKRGKRVAPKEPGSGQVPLPKRTSPCRKPLWPAVMALLGAVTALLAAVGMASTAQQNGVELVVHITCGTLWSYLLCVAAGGLGMWGLLALIPKKPAA